MLSSWTGQPTITLGALAFVLLPGLLIAFILFDDLIDRLALGLSMGYAGAILASLFVSYAPIAFGRTNLLIVFGTPSVLLTIVLVAKKRYVITRPPRDVLLAALFVVTIGALARLIHLGYSEFMGDEAKVLLWATDVLQGRQDIIFLHRKGPAEILVSALFYGLAGSTTELAARLPFALANLLGVLNLFQVAKRISGVRAGLVAGMLAAIDGFFMGFGHMVQYPNLVLALGTAAVYAVYRYYRTGESAFCVAAGICLAGLVLCHWDSVWFGPVILLLLLARWHERAGEPRRMLRDAALIVVPPLVGGALSYVPYFFGPSYAVISRYLAYRVTGSSYSLRNNLSIIWDYAIIYNSIYYAVLVGGALLSAAGWLLREVPWRKHPRRVAWDLLALGALVLVGLVGWRKPWRAFGMWVGMALVLYVVLSRLRVDIKALVVWLVIPFFGYAFAIKKPLLSIYAFMPGAIVLVAQLVSLGISRVKRPLARGVAITALVLYYALCANYAYLAFADTSTQYVRSYPDPKSRLYWVPFGDELPPNAGCGFPHRSGWKTIGVLYDRGVLQGDYYSNEEELVTHWYTRGAIRCLTDPEYLFYARDVKDVQEEMPEPSGYGLVGIVSVDGEPGIEIWELGAHEAVPALYEAGDYAAAFDRGLAGPDLYTGRPRTAPLADIETPLAIRVGDQAEILGLRVLTGDLQAGGIAEVALYWRILSDEKPDMRFALQLSRDGEVHFRWDFAPGCGYLSNSDYFPGNIVVDRYAIPLAQDLAPGWYTLDVGGYLFEYEEGQKHSTPLALSAPGQEATSEERVYMTKLQVGEPPIPSPLLALDARFGTSISLLGSDLPTQPVMAGDTIEVTHYWRALDPPPHSYTVFNHLVDSRGGLLAQRDALPRSGGNPTDHWVEGEIIADRYVIEIPAEAKPGSYVLAVGLYLLETGERLPVSRMGEPAGDYVIVGELTVR